MNIDDIFKDEAVDLDKNVDQKRILQLDIQITSIFMEPTKEISNEIFKVEYTKEEVEKRMEKFKDIIEGYTRNELVAYIFIQKMNFFKRIAVLGAYIDHLQKKIEESIDDDMDNY